MCLIAQILIDRTRLTGAYILVGYVCAGVLLSALGLYGPLVEWAGAGATVPLTGFGHTLAEGVREAVQRTVYSVRCTEGLRQRLPEYPRRCCLHCSGR